MEAILLSLALIVFGELVVRARRGRRTVEVIRPQLVFVEAQEGCFSSCGDRLVFF